MVIEKQKKDKISILLNDLDSLQSYINDIFTFAPLPLCFIGPSGVILEANPAFIKFCGFTFDEIIGKAIEDFFKKKEIEKIIKETKKKGSVEGKETDFFSRTEKEIPCQVFARPRKDESNNILGYFLSIVDLTEIKRNQREARAALINILEDIQEERDKAEEEKNKTLAIVTNFADGILVFDKTNSLLLINPKAEQFLEVKAEDIVLKPILKLSKISSLASLVKILRKKTKEVSREELEAKENLILEVSILPVLRGKEKIGSLVILHDVTREKLIEKMKSEFVSLAAHQLRTPLSTIKWIMRMILDEELGIINKEQRDFLEDGYESNERMIYLINDLLNVTRIEEGRFLYELTPTDIKEIIESTIDSFKSEAKRRKIKIEFRKPKEKIVKIILDSGKIKIALNNLIDNAVRYNVSKGRVIITLRQIGKEIEVSIKDSGMGIPKNQQSRVFTKFFRGVNVMRTDTGGSGLGLYIAKNIIEAHGGKIWFDSELNKGTTFYFKLPIKNKKIIWQKKY